MNLSSSLPTVGQVKRMLPGLLVVAVLLALFHDTAAAMVGIWMRSETFAHAFLVPPISAWLIWRRRAELSRHVPRSVPWLLLPMALACLLWLVAELADVNAATQFTLVLLIVLSVPAVFGFAVAREITFPLMFLFFAVPMGEFLVPYMMEWTADFTVFAVAASGVPVYREGLQFVIPSGNWSVVEACSGVRYLIASFMVGSLFAYLNYQSTTRRVLFMLVSLAAPIVANWLRAYLIVMLGHLSGNELAVGADHLVYGWVFFGIIIMVMFMVGARWSEPDPVPSQPAISNASLPAVSGLDSRTWLVVLGMVAILAATQTTMWWFERPAQTAPLALKLPDTLPAGWSAEPVEAETWVPEYPNPSAVSHRTYRKGDQRVTVWVGYFRDQGPDRKLVSSTNLLVDGHKSRWAVTHEGSAALPPASLSSRVSTAQLREPADPKVEPRQRLQVAHLYWVNGRFTNRASEAKIQLALGRLAGRGDDGAVLMFSTAQPAAQADREPLHAFVAQQLPTLGPWLAATAAAVQR
jgi:exosortase A